MTLILQNYYEKMEKRQERDRDNRKEHTTKLITPQVAKLEHTYRPGKNNTQLLFMKKKNLS